MKFNLLIIGFIFMICLVFTQEGIAQSWSSKKDESRKGSILLGSHLALSLSSKNRSMIRFNPFVGITITDALVGGLRFDYTYDRSGINELPFNEKFQIAPYLRYYLKLDKKINTFFDTGYGIDISGSDIGIEPYTNHLRLQGHTFNLGAGASMIISDNPSIPLEIEIILNYVHDRVKYIIVDNITGEGEVNDRTNQFVFSVGLIMFLDIEKKSPVRWTD